MPWLSAFALLAAALFAIPGGPAAAADVPLPADDTTRQGDAPEGADRPAEPTGAREVIQIPSPSSEDGEAPAPRPVDDPPSAGEPFVDGPPTVEPRPAAGESDAIEPVLPSLIDFPEDRLEESPGDGPVIPGAPAPAPEDGADTTGEPAPDLEPGDLYGSAAASVNRTAQRMQSMSPEWPQSNGPREEPDHEPSETFDTLAGMLDSPSTEARVRALEGLAEEQGPDAVAYLVQALADPERAVREAALAMLENQDPAAVSANIIQSYMYGSPDVHAAMTSALPGLRQVVEDDVVQRLRTYEMSHGERLILVHMLGAMKSSRPTETLAEYVWDPRYPQLAVQAAQALLQAEDPAAARHFPGFVQHANPTIRWIGLQGLAQHGGEEAVRTLQQVAAGPHEPNTRIREAAVELLAQTGDLDAIPAMIQIMQQRPALRRTTAAALRYLTGQPFGMDPTAWVQWYREHIGHWQQQQGPYAQQGPGQQGVQGPPPDQQFDQWGTPIPQGQQQQQFDQWGAPIPPGQQQQQHQQGQQPQFGGGSQPRMPTPRFVPPSQPGSVGGPQTGR